MSIYERDISVKRRGRGSLRGTSYEEFGHTIGFQAHCMLRFVIW